MTSSRPGVLCCLVLICLLFWGCTAHNVSFDVSRSAARDGLREMSKDPKPAARPVLVLGGYLDPGLLTESLGEALSAVGPYL